jgi:CRP-like cAMP-binding protein
MNCFLFKGLNDDELLGATQYFEEPLKVQKNLELYKTGYVGILEQGQAVITRHSTAGVNTTVRTINSGEIFGSASVFGDWQQGFSSIISKTTCTVRYITEDNLTKLFTAVPQVALNYIGFLSDRIRYLNRRLDTFSASGTEQKLYEFLSSQPQEDGLATLPYSMTELSRRLKIGRSSLYRSLESLEANGFITRQKNKFIINKL